MIQVTSAGSVTKHFLVLRELNICILIQQSILGPKSKWRLATRNLGGQFHFYSKIFSPPDLMPAGEADDMLKLFKKSHTVSMIRHQDISARFYWSGILLAGKMRGRIKNQSDPLSFIRRGESCRIARFPTYSLCHEISAWEELASLH